MQTPRPPPESAILATQFKVLAYVFPVLCHDAIRPLSSAKLANAMAHRACETIRPGRAEPAHALLAEVDGLLDEAVASLRGLDTWLRDDACLCPLDGVLAETSRLLFAHLLRSRRTIVLQDEAPAFETPRFAARYALLAWLLHILPGMPEDSTLTLTHAPAGTVTGIVTAAEHARPSPDEALLSWRDAVALAAFHGWAIERRGHAWRASLGAGA